MEDYEKVIIECLKSGITDGKEIQSKIEETLDLHFYLDEIHLIIDIYG